MTVFYRGKLKRTRSPEDVFAKVRCAVKPKGITKKWSIATDCENCLVIDFGDDKSERLSFDFKDKVIDGFCKVAFDGENGEKQLEAFFNLFYSVMKMFTSLEISDEYGLWADFVESKRIKIKIRELTKSETDKIKKIYDSGCVGHNDMIKAIIAKDLNIPSVCNLDFSCNASFRGAGYAEEEQIVEAWLVQTAAYMDSGRIAQYSHKGYRRENEYNEVPELEFAVVACVSGISEMLFMENPPKRFSFGQKQIQVKRLFKEKFLPMLTAENDAFKKCILAYRYVVSVYEYCGFRFVGKV